MICSKKDGKELDFPATGCKLCFGNGFRPHEIRLPCSFLSVISAKEDVNRPSFKNCSFAQECEILQQGPLCLRILLDVSLSFLERVLGRTYIFTYGDASGFFVFSRPLSARKNIFFSKKTMRKPSSMTKHVVPPVLYSNMFFR